MAWNTQFLVCESAGKRVAPLKNLTGEEMLMYLCVTQRLKDIYGPIYEVNLSRLVDLLLDCQNMACDSFHLDGVKGNFRGKIQSFLLLSYG